MQEPESMVSLSIALITRKGIKLYLMIVQRLE